MAAKLTHVDTTEDLKLAETILEKYGIRSAHRVRLIPPFRFRHTPRSARVSTIVGLRSRSQLSRSRTEGALVTHSERYGNLSRANLFVALARAS